MAVYDTQSPADRHILIAEHIRPAEAKQKDHLRGPSSNPGDAGKCADCVFIRYFPDNGEIQLAVSDAL